MPGLAGENLISAETKSKSQSRRRTCIITVLALFLCLPAAVAQAQSDAPGSAVALYRLISSLGLDPGKVYNVRDAALDREDIHIALEDGTIAFTRSVNGRITGALFDGEGTVLIVPPNQVERHSLGMFTQSAVLNERFTRAYFRFDDARFIPDLQPSLRAIEEPEAFVEKYDSLAKTLAAMDALRLLMSLTRNPRAADGTGATPGEFIQARMVGPRGTFDLSWDSASSEQIAVGQSSYTDHGAYYDQWMLFPMRSARQREAERREKGLSNDDAYRDPIQISDYKVRTEVKLPGDISVDATLTLNVEKGGDKVVLFELSRYLKLSSVTLESGAGQVPLEFIQNEAIEGTQLAKRGNDLFAVAMPAALQDSQKAVLHFHYAGSVLSEAGNGLIYVGERGIWYPNRGPMMSKFDLEFKAPAGWRLLATGKLTSRESAGGVETTRWISERAIPLAGFNLGKYTESVAKSNLGDTQVMAYATTGVENTFPSAQPEPMIIARERGRPPTLDLPPATKLNPANNAKEVAERARDTIDFLTPRIGRFPYSALAMTQMPGPDSQGWPGLVFLSSHVFLTPAQRAQGRGENYMKSAEELIYSHLMEAHETAHQWWGDAVFWQTYRDQWLMEALANYCAMLEIEQRSPQEFRAILEFYRKALQTPAPGQTQPRKNAGPVSFGIRLNSAPFPGAYETVAYGRGTWLIHMLREMLRESAAQGKGAGMAEGKDPDAVFYSVLAGLQNKFAGKTMSAQDVQTAFEQAWPKSLRYENSGSLDWFFDGWVNGTAIPKYELQNVRFASANGKNTARFTLLQKDAPDSLITPVPIYAQTAAGIVFVERVFADGNETSLKLSVPAGTRKLLVDPNETVLTAK